MRRYQDSTKCGEQERIEDPECILPNKGERHSLNPFSRRLVILLSTGIYSGYVPLAPGTAGTLVAVPFYWVLSSLSGFFYGITVLAFLFMSSWLAMAAEDIFLKRDSCRIVIDEIGGFLVTMAFLPPLPLYVILGFVFFRFFDVTKPFPIKKLETLGGGYGVVADDVMAGIYSNLALRVCIYLFEGRSFLLG